jgi:hypothetical protein
MLPLSALSLAGASAMTISADVQIRRVKTRGTQPKAEEQAKVKKCSCRNTSLIALVDRTAEKCSCGNIRTGFCT